MKETQLICYYFLLSLISSSFIILGIVLLFSCRRKPISEKSNIEPEEAHAVRPTACAYPLTTIYAATDSFNHHRIIGQGRLGTVYTAILPTGDLAAVKRIHPRLVLSNAGLGFSSIIKILALAQNPNIVPILGFSQAPGERIIVMEFSGMVSLDFYLHENNDGASILDWNRRLSIAAGVARGLEYLHDKVAPNVVHGCVKGSNILLDDKFCAKICDYGLSFLAPNNNNGKRGILGYVDDEYWKIGASKESDVFGYGVVLVEILSGRRNEEGLLVKWALPLIKEMRFNELLDPRLVIPSDIKPLVRLAKVALACVGNSRKSRPSMAQVAAILNNLECNQPFTLASEFRLGHRTDISLPQLLPHSISISSIQSRYCTQLPSPTSIKVTESGIRHSYPSATPPSRSVISAAGQHSVDCSSLARWCFLDFYSPRISYRSHEFTPPLLSALSPPLVCHLWLSHAVQVVATRLSARVS